ncbi:amino acid racemase [Arthrobacter pigmenti]
MGGMGPAATADFYGKLIKATPASRDQDHIRVAIWADPTVPDRSRALLEHGEDPTPWLERGVQHLMECGAEILVVPCNTIHSYLDSVIRDRDVEFISIIDAAVEAAVERDSPGSIGLLATDGILGTGLYQDSITDAGVQALLPSDNDQKVLMQIIYSVKAGKTGDTEREQTASLVEGLRCRGVGTVIAGCTEISVLLTQLNTDIRIIDPSWALAVKTIQRARSTLA